MSSFGKLTIYYWNMLGRAGATIRILEHGGIPYTLKSDFPDIAEVASAFSSTKQDTFAPPIIQDGGLFSIPCSSSEFSTISFLLFNFFRFFHLSIHCMCIARRRKVWFSRTKCNKMCSTHGGYHRPL